MTAALLRALGGALIAAAIVGLGELTYFVALCPQHDAWVRTTADPSQPVRADGFGVAREGDAIFACTVPHCAGPLCHEDRACYCAPSTIGGPALAALVGGECALDKLRPGPQDDFGACRYARCDTHIH